MEQQRRILFLILAAANIHAMLIREPHKDVQDKLQATNLTWYLSLKENWMIIEPYLLTVCVPVKVDASGNRWTDTLWAKDLALHLDHIENLTLASPRIFALPSDSDVRLSGDPFDRIKFVDLPQPINHLQALKTLPEAIKKIWQAVRCNAIVHTGFGGWPISEGLLVTPIAILQRKFLVTNVESSFWRASGDANWHNKIRAVVLERLNRWCIRSEDLRFYTS